MTTPDKTTVIDVSYFREDETRLRGQLRSRMDMGQWRKEWQKAKIARDFEAMDRLDRRYEMVGLP